MAMSNDCAQASRMRTARQYFLDWMEEGRVAPEHVPRALSVAGVFPSAREWRSFLDHLLLWLGTLMLASGVVYFFAYNWDELGRMAKFGLVEALVVASLIAVWRLGVDRIAGKAALLVAAFFVGVLLALIGQTYQTGADTFELFAAWAAFILPWVLVGRFAALWLVWLALVNLATILYFDAFGGLAGRLFGPREQLWMLFGLNTVALLVWEFVAARGRRDDWALRLLALASGGLVTALALFAIIDRDWGDGIALAAWLAWIAAAYVVYRRMLLDVFVLAGGVLSVVIIAAASLLRLLWKMNESAGILLLIGLVVIGLSAVGGWWLKQVAREAQS